MNLHILEIPQDVVRYFLSHAILGIALAVSIMQPVYYFTKIPLALCSFRKNKPFVFYIIFILLACGMGAFLFVGMLMWGIGTEGCKDTTRRAIGSTFTLLPFLFGATLLHAYYYIRKRGYYYQSVAFFISTIVVPPLWFLIATYIYNIFER